MTGVAAALLLIGCLNVSGLMLVRSISRNHELACSIALGATRGRVVQQRVVESVLLVGCAGIAAVVLAAWASHALGATLWAGGTPLALSLTPDARVIAVMIAVTLVIGVLVGAVPAVAAFRRHDRVDLHAERTASPGPGVLAKLLLVVQVAASIVLLVGAGLFAATLANLKSIDIGVRAGPVLLGRAFGVPGGYDRLDPPSYYPELIRRLSMLPGVESVALSKMFPSYFSVPIPLEPIAASDATDRQTELQGILESVSPGFFDTFGVNFVQGRDFAWHDDLRSTPVAIVNATLARRLFADGTAIGRRIRVGTDSARRELSIVGVVGDVVMTNLRAARTVPVVFRPTLQEPQFARASNIDVRLRGDRQTVEPAIRQTVTGLGHEYIRSTETLDEEIDRVLLQERLLATISWCCAALAALIAFVGLYGLLADMVTRRTREIGIRMALGASRRAVVDMIVREALVLTSIGVLVGVPCAVIAARTTSTLLFGLAPSDPRTIFVAAASLLIVGILAGASPARRASRIDPAIALRAE